MKQDNLHIDELIVKHLTGALSAKESDEFSNWLSISEENDQYFSDMQKVWNHSEGIKQFAEIDVEQDFELFKSKVSLSKGRLINLTAKFVMRVAAIVLPVIVFVSLYQTTPGFGKWQAFNTSNSVNSIRLQDNSEVSLNKNSKLVYENDFNEKRRFLKLKGEGYFDVEKNPTKPFVVKVGKAKVKVLGTQFNLEEKSSNEVILAVTEGKVLFSTASNEVEVLAGEKAIAKNGKIVKSKLLSDNCIAWKTGVMEFNNAKLDDVLETIVDHFSEVSSVDNQASYSENYITTKFNNPSLEDVLVELRIHFKKKFEINGNKLIISD